FPRGPCGLPCPNILAKKALVAVNLGLMMGLKVCKRPITWPDKSRELRIRHRSPLPDAALTPYPAYG
ncbi:hypothetical protein KCA24_32735, partial [Escherichia coli]|nr:hypothetical protein [Escherichia coli]